MLEDVTLFKIATLIIPVQQRDNPPIFYNFGKFMHVKAELQHNPSFLIASKSGAWMYTILSVSLNYCSSISFRFLQTSTVGPTSYGFGRMFSASITMVLIMKTIKEVNNLIQSDIIVKGD